MAFAILQEQEGLRHWVFIRGPGHRSLTSARLPPPTDLQYAERETAERDAEIYRQENARDVEATKRRPKYKTEPATYTVVSVDPTPAP